MNALHRNLGPPDGMFQYNNQLQFNLNVPSHSGNIGTNYQHPGPITLEKVGAKTKERPKSTVGDHQNVVKLSQASEEKLSWALQLARRDLKNMIHQQKAKAEEEEKSKKQNVPIKKKKKKFSTTTTKSTKFAARGPSQNVFKKSVKTQTPPTKLLYYSKRGVLNNNLPTGSAERLFRSSTPVRPSSQIPENKADAEKPLDGKENLSPNSRQAAEIKKLRHELKFYIQRIEDLATEAQLTASPSRRDEDEKDVLRRKVKKAEQTNRSSRLLYSLHQQVRELQEDLNQAGPRKIKQSKKSQIFGRLAAAHRRAVRILQAFLHQLPEQVTDEGTLPPLYQELGELIHKLSLCTRQLEIDGNGIPDDVFAIFRKLQTPQRQYQSPEINRRRRSPASIHRRRKLDFGKNLFSGQSHSDKSTVSPLLKEYVHPPTVHHLPPQSQFTPGFGTAQRLRSDVTGRIATPGSPERSAAIKAGLEALMRISGPEGMRDQDLRKTKPILSKKRPLFQRKKKGTLFPSNAKSVKSDSRTGSDKTRNANYLQATKASQLKMTTKREVTEKDKLDEKPPWAPPGSPRSFHRSPTQRKPQQGEEEDAEDAAEEPKPQNLRTKRVLFEDEEETVNNINVDQGEESSRGLRDGRRLDWLENDDFEASSGYHGNSIQSRTDVEAIINQAEKRIFERLAPLLATTGDATDGLNKQQRTCLHSSEHEADPRTLELQDGLRPSEHQVRLQPPDKEGYPQSMTEKVADQAGPLGDLLLEEVLDDTAQEVEGIEREDEADRLAFNLQNSSTLETMLQTLERMEAEEERIRRRWRKVSYRDPAAATTVGKEGLKKDPRELMMGTPLEGDLLERLDEPPVLHTGIQITTEPVKSGRTISISEPGLSEPPIHSSDSESSSALEEEDFSPAQESLHSWRKHPDRRFSIRVSSDLKREVTKNQETFKKYLRKKSHLSYGDFDPWKLISEVSDDLVDGILHDIAEEMVDFSGDFMDAIYKTEFAEEVK